MAERRKLLNIVIPNPNKMIETSSCIVSTKSERVMLEPDQNIKYDHHKLALKVKAYNRAIGIYKETDFMCAAESPVSITTYMTSFPKIQSCNHFSPRKSVSNRFPEEILDSELCIESQSPNSVKNLLKHDRFTSLYKLKNKLLSRRERKKQELRNYVFTQQRIETNSPVSFPPLCSSILHISHITPATGRTKTNKFIETDKVRKLHGRINRTEKI